METSPKIIHKITQTGQIIENTIKYINQINNVEIREYIIMPDHIHFILKLNNELNNNGTNLKNILINDKIGNRGRGGTLPLQKISVNEIVGRLKSYTTKQYNILNNTIGIKLWQRNYYEHIIRNKNDYYRICKYIKNNPVKYIEKNFFN